MSAPIRQPDLCAKWADIPQRVWSPQGYLAPAGSAEFNNYRAACIAAREVRGKAAHSEAHRRSLEAWERGERSWPWPDNEQPADDVVRALLPGLLTDEELLTISKAHRAFERGRVA